MPPHLAAARPVPRSAVDLDAVRAGFSRKAAEYDERLATHPVDRWARARIREVVLGRLRPGDAILEINAGTGSDAALFADQGFRVHATDVAEGMVARIRTKIQDRGSPPSFTAELRSFTELAGVAGAPYDLVFSNFGGLNCTDRLPDVARELSRVLRPGGFAVLVVAPPVCPWEHVQIVRGHWRTATRRWVRGGAWANVEGARVHAWYHTPSAVQRAFGPRFRRRILESVCLFAPALFLEGFPRRHASLTHLGMWMDERLASRWPFSTMGDFCVLTLQLRTRRRLDRPCHPDGDLTGGQMR